MSAPFDRRGGGGDPGGCSCDWCGVVYIGAEWQDGCCAVCLEKREAAALRKARAVDTGVIPVMQGEGDE